MRRHDTRKTQDARRPIPDDRIPSLQDSKIDLCPWSFSAQAGPPGGEGAVYDQLWIAAAESMDSGVVVRSSSHRRYGAEGASHWCIRLRSPAGRPPSCAGRVGRSACRLRSQAGPQPVMACWRKCRRVARVFVPDRPSGRLARPGVWRRWHGESASMLAWVPARFLSPMLPQAVQIPDAVARVALGCP